MTLILELSQGVLLILLSPLIVGIERYLSARFQTRHRSWRYILQPYVDLYKLANTPSVLFQTTTWFNVLTPALLWMIMAFLAFTTSFGLAYPLIGIDVIFLIAILGLFRFLLSLAGWDGEASFGSLGGAREMFIHFLTEVNFLLFMMALILFWQIVQPDQLSFSDGFNLGALLKAHQTLGKSLYGYPQLWGLLFSMAILIFYEIQRSPVGNPHTHLELTMTGKAITLVWAGRELALAKWAKMIKFTFSVSLFVSLFFPTQFLLPTSLTSWQKEIADVILFGLKTLLTILVLALWEEVNAKLRLTRIISPAYFSGTLSLLVILYTLATVIFSKGGN